MKKKSNRILKTIFVLNFFINFLLIFCFVLTPILNIKIKDVKFDLLGKKTPLSVIIFLVGILIIIISVFILIITSLISFFYIKNYSKNKLILIINSFFGLLGGLLIFGLITSLFCVLKNSKR